MIFYDQLRINLIKNAQYSILQYNKIKFCNQEEMSDKLRHICLSQTVPGKPIVAFRQSKNAFYHVYEHVPLQTDNFQSEIKSYLSRKQSFSGNVLSVHKIMDEKIAYNLGNPSMEISIVTEFIPWRLNQQQAHLTFEQGLFILDGCCKGFRQLLHRLRIPFLVQQNMVGIDGNGKVKVWWNELFYKSKMNTPIFQPIKLKTMVKSLIMALQLKMNPESVNQFQTIFKDCQNFQLIEQKVKLNSKGLKLQYFGKKLIKNLPQFYIISTQLKEPSTQSTQKSGLSHRPSLSNLSSFREKSFKQTSYSKKIQQSGTRQVIIEFSKRPPVRKRHLSTVNSISPDEKIKLIKLDIENLREKSNSNEKESSNRLRSALSVGSLHSYNLGISPNKHVPEINKLINEAKVLEDQNSLLKISKFIEPRINSKITPFNISPRKTINEGNEIQSKYSLRQKGSVFLPGLRSGIFTEKQANSTAQSCYESKMLIQKNNGNSTQRSKMLSSDKKQSEGPYTTSSFDI